MPRVMVLTLRFPKPRTSFAGSVAPLVRYPAHPLQADRTFPRGEDDRLLLESLQPVRDGVEAGRQPAQLELGCLPGERLDEGGAPGSVDDAHVLEVPVVATRSQPATVNPDDLAVTKSESSRW